MSEEKLKHRNYILRRYIDAGGTIQDSDYYLFGYFNKAEFCFRLAALEREGVIQYQYVQRVYTTCVVYEYFYALPGKGTPINRYESKKQKIKFVVGEKRKIAPDKRYLRRMSVKRSIVRAMQRANITEIYGLTRAMQWVKGTFRGKPCSDINIVMTTPKQIKKPCELPIHSKADEWVLRSVI